MSSTTHPHRNGRPTTRPRSFTAPSHHSPRFPDFSTKKAAPRHPLARVPMAAVAFLIVLAIFVLSVFSSNNVTFVTKSVPIAAQENTTRPIQQLDPPAPPPVEREQPPQQPAPVDATRVSENTLPEPQQKQQLSAQPPLNPDSEQQRAAAVAPAKDTKPLQSEKHKQQQQQSSEQLNNDFSRNGVTDTGYVSWIRSWPDSDQHDKTNLIPLAKYLNFNNRTLLNYFHMHKTGGVSTKSELMHLVERSENKPQLTKRGAPLGYIETCYKQQVADSSDTTLERNWRCDFGQVKTFSKEKLRTFDIVMGHQYWENGCEYFFGGERDVRHFSLFRHPLPRKLSFFYHFFVRNVGRDEGDADKDEVIRFLLGEMEADPRVRDAGPNYYASRLLSDGRMGFSPTSQRYEVDADKEDEAIDKVLDRLENRFAFVGLQLQTEASQCMLEKAVQVMAHEHGIDSLVGTSLLSDTKTRKNTGGYPWTSLKIWAAMTEEQREKYRKVERVDLAIYHKAVERFKSDVKIYDCSSKVDEAQWAEDAYV